MKEIEKQKNSYRFMNFRPAGNDTALVERVILDPIKRKEINDQMMKEYPTIEQVGFVNLDPNNTELIMAGGEFCGNATRSTAYAALKGKEGVLSIVVSGVDQPLYAGVTNSGEAFTEMPIYKEPSRIVQDKYDKKSWIVEMKGITQYVVTEPDRMQGATQEDLKKEGMRIIKSRGLDTAKAAGVVYLESKPNGWGIKPVVYVRDINTLFAETACGSGTIAFAQVFAKETGKSIVDMTVIQPTGLPIKASVAYDGKEFGFAQISGPVELLSSGLLEQTGAQSYVIEKIQSSTQLLSNQSLNSLSILYKTIFSQPPYYEEFTTDEVINFFTEYAQNGLLFIARSENNAVGFGAALPLIQAGEEISNQAISCGFNPKETWYMADLGVGEAFRRSGVGTKLVRERLRSLPPNSVALMRTSEENRASQNLYKSLGFTVVPNMIQYVNQKRTDGETKKDKRIFLSKKI